MHFLSITNEGESCPNFCTLPAPSPFLHVHVHLYITFNLLPLPLQPRSNSLRKTNTEETNYYTILCLLSLIKSTVITFSTCGLLLSSLGLLGRGSMS